MPISDEFLAPEARDPGRRPPSGLLSVTARVDELPEVPCTLAGMDAMAGAAAVLGPAIEGQPTRSPEEGTNGLEALVESPDEQPEAVVFSPSPDAHYFAFALETLATRSAVGGGRNGRAYARGFLRRKEEFLATALGAGMSLELRIASRPGTAQRSGRVAVTLLARLREGGPERAAGLARELQRLQRATLPEHELRPLAASAVALLLCPHHVADAVELRRCVRPVRLDTRADGAESRARVGYPTLDRADPQSDEAPDVSVAHVFPFAPSQGSLGRLFSTLLATPGQVSLSFRAERATVSPDEVRFLEHQIALCESHAQTALRGAGDDLSGVRPTLQVRARQLERVLSRSLDRLRREAALLRIWIAADRPLPATLVHQVGRLLSASRRPARGGEGSDTLAGGYEVVGSRPPESGGSWLGWDDLPLPRAPELSGVDRLAFLFSLEAAAAAFQLPPAAPRAVVGVEMRAARELVPPHDGASDGLLLGRARYQGSSCDFRMSAADRQQHVYVCGQTGTGKSTLLAGMILADIERGEGVCVIDPHGDLYEDVLRRIPSSRLQDVVLVDPTDEDWPVSVNPLEIASPAERHFAIDAFLSVMERVLEDQYGLHGAREYAGPVFWQQVRMNLSLLTHDPERPATLLDFCAMFQENGYWKKWTPLKSDEPQLKRWVENTLTQMDFTRMGNDTPSWGIYVGSKFENFIFFPPLRRIFGQARSTIDFRKVMDEGKILLVNLAKGDLTEINARFLGMILLAKLQAAAMSRTDTAREKRRPFYLYVDEFGARATRFFIALLSEGRKFGISLVLANQFVRQIKDEGIRDAIFGNVGTIVSFRTGHDDAVRLASEFYPGPKPRDFVSLPNWRAYTRAVTRGRRVPAFVLETIPLAPANDEIAAARVQALSRTKYGVRPAVSSPSSIAS